MNNPAPRLASLSPAPHQRGRRDEAREATLERILRAAATVFAHAGYDGATLTMIALAAELPKANINYYFQDKTVLYRRVLSEVQDIWAEPLGLFEPESDPVETLERYITAKIELARRYPIESRVFASEMIHGAPFIANYLRTDYNRKIAKVFETFDNWIRKGLIDPIDPKHLLLQIWAATQTYADHEPQVAALLGTTTIAEQEYNAASEQLSSMVIKGIGAKRLRPGRRKS